MSSVSFFDLASELHAAGGPRRVGRSIFDVMEKTKSLFEDEDSNDEELGDASFTSMPPGDQPLKKVGKKKEPELAQTSPRKLQVAERFTTRKGLYQIPTIRTKEEILAHIEASDGTMMINVMIDSSLTKQFQSPAEYPALSDNCFDEASPFVSKWRSKIRTRGDVNVPAPLPTSLSFRVKSTTSVNSLVGFSLRRWLKLRKSLQLPIGFSQRSPYHRTFRDDPTSEIISLFSDAALAIADAKGTPVVALRRLVRNKKGNAVVPPAPEGPRDEFTYFEEASAAQLAVYARCCGSTFSTKGLATLLGTKTFPEALGSDTGQKGASCLVPPYHFVIFFPVQSVQKRGLMQLEEEGRHNILCEADHFMKQFARPYFQVFLATDLERRRRWYLEQANRRHQIHEQFLVEFYAAELLAMENDELEIRREIMLSQRSEWLSAVHLQFEVLMFLASYHRQRKCLEEDEALGFHSIKTITSQCFEESQLLERLQNAVSCFVATCEDLETSDWRMRLELLHASTKLIVAKAM